jgi:SAM-dependent methyltransferase
MSDAGPRPQFRAARRSAGPEFLDDARLSHAELTAILRDLARFNGAMFGHWPALSWLKRVMRDVPSGQVVTLLDVGCGYGDMLRAIRRFSVRRGLSIRLIGMDLSADVVAVARQATPAADDIEYRVGDVFALQSQEPIDFIISSLVTHHMTDAEIERFLRWMEITARRGWFIYDLQRSRVPYHFIALSGWLMRVHPVVVNDGRISVARSLTRGEWEQRIAAAGIPRKAVDLRWFMFRFGIGRVK